MTTTPPSAPAAVRATPESAFGYLRLLLDLNASGEASAADVVQRLHELLDQGVVDRESDTIQAWPRDFAELRPTGLLWLINRQVFHPRGYALGLDTDRDGVVLGWRLLGDGSEPFNFEDGTETDHMVAANRTLGGAA